MIINKIFLKQYIFIVSINLFYIEYYYIPHFESFRIKKNILKNNNHLHIIIFMQL